jgi:hypothetical protein
METKTCDTCHETKDLATCFKKEVGCYRKTCKPCMNLVIAERRKKKSEEKKAAEKEEKEKHMALLKEQGRPVRTCDACLIEKDLEEGFHIDNGAHRRTCKDCFNAKRRETRPNTEHYKKELEHYHEHKEEIQAKAKEAKELKKAMELEKKAHKEMEELLQDPSTRVCKGCGVEKDLATAFKKVGDKWFSQTCRACKSKITIPESQEYLDLKEKEKQAKEDAYAALLTKWSSGEELSAKEKRKIRYESYYKDIQSARSKLPESRKKRNEMLRKRKEEDPVFRIRLNLGARVHDVLHNKTEVTNALLGCSNGHVKFWLAFQFKPGMSWENYGTEWHIDHVIPIKYFDIMNSPNERFACFNWTNLRPLSKKENISKGSKILLSDINEHLQTTFTFLSIYPEYQTKYENVWWPRLKLGYGYNFKDENELKQFIQNGQSASKHLQDMQTESFNEILKAPIETPTDEVEEEEELLEMLKDDLDNEISHDEGSTTR